ncbi:MAG: hypothetical protein JRJ26_02575 [Deltaproteobacteria bacterium]|nr:hypothetical protein [Deltaproteobacteria bacterium]
MKIGIPLFGKRVSPNFCAAPELLVVLAQGRSTSSTLRLGFSDLTLSGRRRRILSLGVDILICGGIDRATRQWFESRGINVIENTRGEAMDVLSRLLSRLGRAALEQEDTARGEKEGKGDDQDTQDRSRPRRGRGQGSGSHRRAEGPGAAGHPH